MKTKRIAALCLAVLMLFGFSACKNPFKKVKREPLSVTLSFVHYDDGLKASFLKNKDRFVKNLAATYGMSAEQANDLLKNSDKYGVFRIESTVVNQEEGGRTFAKVEASGAHDGVWLCRNSLNGQLGVPAGTTTHDFELSFVADIQKLDASAIYQPLRVLSFTVYYYDTPANDDVEVAESAYRSLTAHNNIDSPDSSDPIEGLSVSLESVEDGGDYEKLFRTDKAALLHYGFDAAAVDRFTAKGSQWACYLLNVKVVNSSAEEILFYDMEMPQNGIDGVWVAQKSLDGDEFGLSGGTESTFAYLLLVDPEAAGSATLTDSVKAMKLSLQYTVERTDIDQLETCLRVPNIIPVAG